MSDEILIQRLVDNELPPEQRTQLIDRIGWRDGDWQAIAMAFLDNQWLDQSLTQLVEDFERPQREKQQREKQQRESQVESEVSELESLNGVHTYSSVSAAKKIASDRQPDHHSLTKNINRMRWAIGSLAAALAMAWFGFALGQVMNRGSETPPLVGSQVNSNDPNANESADEQIAGLQLTDALARCRAPIPREFRLELLRAGYVLKENQAIKPVALPFGGQVEIPVREFDLKFVGNSAYQ